MASALSSAHAPRRHPRVEAPLEAQHPQLGALRRHRLAQLVGLGGAEPRDGDRHLHQLLLEQRHPERALAGSARRAGAGSVTGSSPRRRRRYGLTALPWIGPGRMSATSITRS